MNEEKFKKAEKLRSDINDTRKQLELASKNVGIHHVFDTGATTFLRISTEVRTIVQTIVVAHLTKKLADQEKEYAEL